MGSGIDCCDLVVLRFCGVALEKTSFTKNLFLKSIKHYTNEFK